MHQNGDLKRGNERERERERERKTDRLLCNATVIYWVTVEY
jgi:hypothetical protein